MPNSQFPENNVTGTLTAEKVAVTSSDADALDVTGGLTIGSGDVALVGTDGKISGPLSTTIIDDLSGANLTTINASALSSGTVATARLGSGTASSSTFLRGDGAWEAAGGGGGFPFLDKASLTSGELQTGTISLAASGCLVVFQNVEVATDNVSLHLIINGTTSGYEQVARLSRIDGNVGYGANPTDALYLDSNIATHGRIGNATGEQASGHLYLTCDGTYLNWHGLVYEQNPNADPTITQVAGFLNLGGAVTSITMAASSGDIDGGEMMVYDIAES